MPDGEAGEIIQGGVQVGLALNWLAVSIGVANKQSVGDRQRGSAMEGVGEN